MLAISIRVRQFIWTQTDRFQMQLRNSVFSVAVVSAALVALAAFLLALIVLIVSVAQIVFVAVVAAAVAAAVIVVDVATVNVSRFLAKTRIVKVPAVVAGTFLNKDKHMKQVTVHRIIVLVIISI